MGCLNPGLACSGHFTPMELHRIWPFAPGFSLSIMLAVLALWFESKSCSVVSDCLRLHGLYSPWNSPGQNTGVGSLSLLQRIFPTQGSNPGLLHCRWILYQLNHKGSPALWPLALWFGPTLLLDTEVLHGKGRKLALSRQSPKHLTWMSNFFSPHRN